MYNISSNLPDVEFTRIATNNTTTYRAIPDGLWVCLLLASSPVISRLFVYSQDGCEPILSIHFIHTWILHVGYT